jgi:deazaflavin-dependent oxidoreductase (nitroreductase family)
MGRPMADLGSLDRRLRGDSRRRPVGRARHCRNVELISVGRGNMQGKWVVRSFSGLVVATIALWVVFTIAMRSNYAPIVDRVRRFNRSVGNPRAMATAGQQGAYASVIRHRGRMSGTAYETPVGPFAFDDGFVIPLPYGATADWVQNVLAAGSAVIVNEGETYHVGDPELVSADVAMPEIPAKYQWSLRLYNVDQFLRVRTVAR